jgi:hypothetical protein
LERLRAQRDTRPLLTVNPSHDKQRIYRLIVDRKDQSVKGDGLTNVHVTANQHHIYITFQCDPNTTPNLLPLMEMF